MFSESYSSLGPHRARHTSRVLTVVLVVFPLILKWQLVTQSWWQSQQAGSTGTRGQRGLQACWMGGERDWNGMAMGEVLSLELLLLIHIRTHGLQFVCGNEKAQKWQHLKYFHFSLTCGAEKESLIPSKCGIDFK